VSDNITQLEAKINQFEASIREMKEATREAHSVLKQLRQERKEIERIMSTEVKAMVNKRAEDTVKEELDKIGPEIHRLTDTLYSRVQTELDKMVDLCLGKEFSIKHGREDLRPDLARNLRRWIVEIMQSVNEDESIDIEIQEV